MCWSCDNPNAVLADYLDLIHRAIDTHGWFIQHVEKERWRPSLSYTVGLTELGCPELLVTGLVPRMAGRVLQTRAHDLAFHHAEPTVHCVMAEATYGPDLHAVQLVYTDDRGRWPWQVGFRGNQSVLGPRAPGLHRRP